MIKIILLAYLLLINIITYFTYAADKTKSPPKQMANPRTNPHPPGTSGRLPRRPLHETLPPQNPPPEIQIRNPYYSNHSNNNHIFLYPQYLKYLIPQHSRLTGAVCPLFTILQISPQHQPWQPAQADGWSFDNLERLADRNKVPPLPLRGNGDETQTLWKPLLTQCSHSEAHRNAFAPWEAVDFISIRKLSQPPTTIRLPPISFRKSSESLIQYYIDSLYYITYNILNKTI